MDSVSSRHQDERVRAIRDEYRKREKDLEIKHGSELKRLSQKYVDSLDNLRKQNEAQLHDFRNKARASLNEKDLFYQDQIHGIQVANRRHLENQIQEVKAKHQNQVDSLTTQMFKDKQINKLQQQRLNKTFSNEIEKKDKLYQELTTENARKSRQQLADRINDISRRHTKIQRSLAEDRDAKLAVKSEQIQLQKQNAVKELNDTKRLLGNRIESERRSALTNLIAEREAHTNINMMQRSAFKEGLEDVRTRYKKQYDTDRDAARKARESFEDQVTKRQNDRIGGLTAKVAFMRKVHDGEKLKLRQSLDHEKKIVHRAFRKAVKNFEDSRGQLIKEFNKITHNEVNDVIREKDNHFKQQMRRMRDDMTTRDLINRQAIEDLKTYHEERQVHVETQADRRVRAMNDDLNRSVKTMDGNFKARLEQQKDDFQQSLRDIRLRTQEERVNLVRRFNNAAKEREKFYDNKIKDMKIVKRNEVEHMKRDFERELKSVVDSKDRRFNVQRRAYEKQLNAQRLYYEEKAQDMARGHEEELKRMKRSHSEQTRKMIMTTQQNARNRAAASKDDA